MVLLDSFDTSEIGIITGIDSSYRNNEGIAAVVALFYPDMQVIAEETARGQAPFPSIPDLLLFREAPLVLQALEKLTLTPKKLSIAGTDPTRSQPLRIDVTTNHIDPACYSSGALTGQCKPA